MFQGKSRCSITVFFVYISSIILNPLGPQRIAYHWTLTSWCIFKLTTFSNNRQIWSYKKIWSLYFEISNVTAKLIKQNIRIELQYGVCVSDAELHFVWTRGWGQPQTVGLIQSSNICADKLQRPDPHLWIQTFTFELLMLRLHIPRIQTSWILRLMDVYSFY